MLNQGTVDWLEKEARHVKRVSQDVEQLRKDHRKRVMELLNENPDEANKLLEILRLTNGQDH